ncbi:hypothetical protein CPC16_010083 [Podila verticillata]|nr:hypothetical protein CPC16_010083 [Podila verticillata]
MTKVSKDMGKEQVNSEEVSSPERAAHMDVNTLEIVVRFMYIQLVPTQLATFQDEDEEDDGNIWTATSSWEKTLIASERSKVEELQRMACLEVLHDLSGETTIHFLFKTAYLYYDFRAPVVEYVARTLRRVKPFP